MITLNYIYNKVGMSIAHLWRAGKSERVCAIVKIDGADYLVTGIELASNNIHGDHLAITAHRITHTTSTQS